jgi:zinc protease
LQIADSVAQLGATLSTASNMDATFVQGASLKKNFGALLDLIADVTLRPSFPAEEIERQRAIRLGQLVQRREDPTGIANTVYAAVLYGERHPYGFTELGTDEAVKAMTRDDMLAFWKQNFVANNAALVVAGDISMAELRPLVERTFGAWASGKPASPVFTAPQTSAARLVIVDKPGSPQTTLRIVGMGVPRSSPDFQTIQVMNTALGGSFSSRINMNLREDHGYTYGASSQFVFRRSAGPFVAAAGVRTDVTGPAVTEFFNELRGLGTRPIAGEELTRSKDSMARSLPSQFETSANTTASFANVFVYDLGLDYYTKVPERVNAVSAEQVAAAAKKYIDPSKFIVIAVGDRAKIEPELKKLDLSPAEIWTPDGKRAGPTGGQ